MRDVLNHVTGGATMFGLCVRDGEVSDEKLGELMTGDNLGADFKASFHQATDDAEESFAIPGAMDRIVKLPFGEMPAGIAVNIAIFDVATHAWDLAKATGQSTDLDPEVVGVAYQVAQNMLSDDLRNAGMFGPAVAVADDAPVADRLAGSPGARPSQVSVERYELASERLGDRGIGDCAGDGVHALRQLDVGRGRAGHPLGGQRDRVRQRRVRERVRGGVRHRRGDVADRVVQHAVDLVDGLRRARSRGCPRRSRPGRSRSRRSPNPAASTRPSRR